VKFVNSFARRQHLFEIAATPIDIDLNIWLYPAHLFLSQFRQKCCDLIRCVGNDYLPRISSKSVPYSCKAKELTMALDRSLDGHEVGTDKTRQKHNAFVAA